MNFNCDIFELNQLPGEVVSAHWKDGYFSDESEVPSEYEELLASINLPAIFKELSTSMFKSLRTGSLAGWPELIDQGVDFKSLLYLIHHLLCSAIAQQEVESHRTNGVWAARLYFSFIATPQGSPFLIYHSHLYKKALQVLQFGVLLEKPEVQSPVGRRRSGWRKGSNDAQNTVAPYVILDKNESQVLLHLLIDGERDLLAALDLCELKDKVDAVALTVEALSNVAIQETFDCHLLSKGISETDRYCRSSLAMNAFCGLLSLCATKHGEVEETVRIIMRYCFEGIMLEFQKDTKGLSPSYTTVVRDVFIDFVINVCKVIGEGSGKGIYILLQHICLYAPERLEARTKLVECGVRLILKLPELILLKSIIVLVTMSCNDISSVRLFSVEILGKYLSSLKVNFEDDDPESSKYNLHKIAFAAVLARVQDVSTLVRSKAMSHFVLYVHDSSVNAVNKYLLSEVFVNPYINHMNVQEVPKRSFRNFNEVAKSLQDNPSLDLNSLPCAQTILEEFLYFSDDPKVTVRKGALQCVLEILSINKIFMDGDLLAKICYHCQDESTLVKKMMVQDLTKLLLSFPSHRPLLQQWVISVVPLIIDPEKTVSEKVLENMGRAILDNMVLDSQMKLPQHHLPWMLMSLVSHLQLQKSFLKACYMWKEDGQRLRRLIPIIKSHIGMGKPYNDSAWVTLKGISEVITLNDPKFVLDFYHNEIYNIPNVSTYISRLVMEVLWFTWEQLPESYKRLLATELNTDLNLFKVPVPLISRAIDIRHGFYLSDREGGDVVIQPDWAVDLIKRCEESIFESLRLNLVNVHDEEAMKRFVITLGNACLYCPRTIQSETIKQLLHMLSSSQEEEDLWTGSCGVELKAGLISTLGKIGLQNEALAKKLIDVLGNFLSQTRESLLKNNIMICLTDLCIRYTYLGDDILPDMCVCLKDRMKIVRENTLKLLAQLVQEDYIKMRDNISFHLLSMLNDEDSAIVNMTRIFFVETVLRKKSTFFSSCFIPSLFHYNRYEHHRQHSRVQLTSREREVFDLSGPENEAKRHKIYRFMLIHSDVDSRFSISRRLCIEICNGVLENKIRLDDENGEAVLKDCLNIMDFEEIHIIDRKDGDDDGDDFAADEEEVSEVLLNSAHVKILSDLVKKHVLETEIPTLARLKRKLACQKSPLTGIVLKLICNMLQEHKIDASDVLRKDPQLIRELKRMSSIGESSLSDLSDREDSGSESETYE